MRQNSFHILGALVLLTVLTTAAADAQNIIRLSADRIAFYYDRFLVEADGNVRLTTSDGMTVTGDAFSMDLKLNRYLISSHVHLRSRSGELSGAAIANFLDFNRIYFIPVIDEPDRWTYLDADLNHPVKGREMPGDTFEFPQLGDAQPDLIARSAAIIPKSFVRFAHATAYLFGVGVPLPSFYVNFGLNQNLAQNSLSGASFDATWNATGNNNSISAVHLREDPVNHLYASLEEHLAGSHEYAVFSINPATTRDRFWNLFTGDRIGKRFGLTTFSQLFTSQSGLSQPTQASLVNSIDATLAFPQSYLTSQTTLVNYNLIGTQSSAQPDHPTASQLTASTFSHQVAHLPIFEQLRYGIGFNHDAYGLQQYGGVNYTTIWNHLAGFSLYTPSFKFGNRENGYKTFYFNAAFDKQRQWFSVPHRIDTTTTNLSVSRTFSRAFSGFTSYNISNTGDYYNQGGYQPFVPVINGLPIYSFASFRGVATLRTTTLQVAYSANPNFLATVALRQHRDFPVPAPGLFSSPPTNVLGQYLYSSFLGQPPYDISGEVRALVGAHFMVDVQRSYYFNFGTQRWSPQFVIQVSPQ